jgi:GNAT superfamily N-acetyltransferase
MVEESEGYIVSNDMRTMNPDDIPSAIELSTIANWNQTPKDWDRILRLSAEGCRCIEDDGQIFATATLLPYGAHLAWIGMVLTRPENRRQGLARRLMDDAITTAERCGIRTLKLDATDEGRPLYESLGFVVEQEVERWGRDRGESVAVKRELGFSKGCCYGTRISDEMFLRDATAFGVARKELLEELSASGRCITTENGYMISRPGRTARHLGPCVAASEAEARQLIAAHLEDPTCSGDEHEASKSSGWYWDLLPVNREAVRCAAGFGFTRRRALWRMRRGDVIKKSDAMVYAVAGFELG